MPYDEPKLTPLERKLTDQSRLPADDPEKIAEDSRTQVGRTTMPTDKSVPPPAKVEFAGELERKG